MLPIRWRAQALDDLDAIIVYVAERNPQAAEALRERIESALLPTSEHPYLFRSGRVLGTREIIAHPNFIVVYRVTDECALKW